MEWEYPILFSFPDIWSLSMNVAPYPCVTETSDDLAPLFSISFTACGSALVSGKVVTSVKADDGSCGHGGAVGCRDCRDRVETVCWVLAWSVGALSVSC